MNEINHDQASLTLGVCSWTNIRRFSKSRQRNACRQKQPSSPFDADWNHQNGAGTKEPVLEKCSKVLWSDRRLYPQRFSSKLSGGVASVPGNKYAATHDLLIKQDKKKKKQQAVDPILSHIGLTTADSLTCYLSGLYCVFCSSLWCVIS